MLTLRSKVVRQLGPALLFAGAVLGLLVAEPELAAQRTITVCAQGCDFTKIQDAINAARAGDTIEVRVGTYQENLTIRDKQDLILQGAGHDQVTLDGSLKAGERDIIPGILIVNSRNITVRGFKIINSRRGLEARDTTLLLLEANAFESNLRQGMAITHSEAQLVGNSVKGTQPDRDGAFGQGVDIFGSQAVLTDNIIVDGADCGLRVTHSGERPGQASGSNNTIQNNKGGDLCGNAPLTLLAQPPPEGTLEQVAVPQDASTIQEAVDKVKSGGTITVAAGAYQGQVQIYKSVKIVGAGPEQTVLQALSSEWTALNIATDQLDVMIEGLNVAGGRRGVQIDTGPAGSVTLRNVKVEGNGSGRATEVGMLVFGQGIVTLDQTSISGNQGNGLWAFGQPEVVIQKSSVSQNGGHGVVASGQPTLTIENSTITNNTVRGIGLFGSAKATIRQNTITDNRTFGGIVVRGSSSAKIEGNTITRNVEEGVWVGDSAQAEIINNTITENRPDAQGRFGYGIIVVRDARVTVRENTITGHPLSGILLGSTGLANENLQAEISQNRIQNNRECGVWTDRDPGIRITGRGNTISGNAVANLCGDLSKFPPGFGGGR